MAPSLLWIKTWHDHCNSKRKWKEFGVVVKMFQKTAKNVSKTAKSVNSFQSFPSITGTLEKVILQSPKGLSATVLKRVDMVAFRLQTYEVWDEILEIIPSKHCRELLPITSRKVNSSRNCWMTLVDNTDREFWKKRGKIYMIKFNMKKGYFVTKIVC